MKPPHPSDGSELLRDGQRIHLVDAKGRHYALTLKAGEVFQHSGETLPH
jgi:tRNA (adenine57-N1/adenine58-N1)-methyltransferase